MQRYRRYKVTEHKHKVAVILRCPDHRLIDPHKNFIRDELGLVGSDYFSLKRAGGARALARGEESPKVFADLFKEISMFVEKHPEIRYIILISHEDCRRYDKERKPLLPDLERRDLLVAAKIMAGMSSRVHVGAYFARFTDKMQKEAFFETVFETDSKSSRRKAHK